MNLKRELEQAGITWLCEASEQIPDKQGKSLTSIYNESPKQLSINCLKLIKVDTGGTPGTAPQALVDLVRQIRGCNNDDDAGAVLYQYLDEHSYATRTKIQPRLLLLELRATHGPKTTLRQYLTVYVHRMRKMIRNRHRNKRSDRAALIG